MTTPKKPNILVIFGDDIGIWNLSCYSTGMMGYRTPNIDRIAEEGMRFTDSYGEQSCTAGRASFITGQSVSAPGSRRSACRAPMRAAGRGSDHRRAAQAARLRDRPVRQEPLRRSQQVPADGARLRRVLRQPLPPQRRGGARGSRTTRPPKTSPQFKKRYGPRGVIALLGDRQGRPDRGAALGTRRQATIEDTGPLTKKRMETLRRRVRRRRQRLHQAPARGGQAVVLLAQHDAHAPPHAHQAREHRPGRAAGSRRTTTR